MTGMNHTKAMLLMSVLTVLVVWIGYALGGQTGLLLALLFAGALNFASFRWSAKLVLRMYGAREINEHAARELFRLVRELTGRADMPMPKVDLIPEETPSAFATGRNPQPAAVAVADGFYREGYGKQHAHSRKRRGFPGVVPVTTLPADVQRLLSAGAAALRARNAGAQRGRLGALWREDQTARHCA